MPFKDPELRRAYQRELMRKRRAKARGVSPASVSPAPVSPVSPCLVSPVTVSPVVVNSPDKARARKLQALAKNPTETAAAREGFRLRFDELAARLGLSPLALSAAL